MAKFIWQYEGWPCSRMPNLLLDGFDGNPEHNPWFFSV